MDMLLNHRDDCRYSQSARILCDGDHFLMGVKWSPKIMVAGFRKRAYLWGFEG